MRRKQDIFFEKGHARTEARMQSSERRGHPIEAAQFHRLGCGKALNGKHLLHIVEDAPELQGTVRAHADVVLLAV